MRNLTATSKQDLINLGAKVTTNKYMGHEHLVIHFKDCVNLNGVISKKFATGGLMRNGFKQINNIS